MHLPPVVVQLVLIFELDVDSIERVAQRQSENQNDNQNRNEQSGIRFAETLWLVIFEATLRYLSRQEIKKKS